MARSHHQTVLLYERHQTSITSTSTLKYHHSIVHCPINAMFRLLHCRMPCNFPLGSSLWPLWLWWFHSSASQMCPSRRLASYPCCRAATQKKQELRVWRPMMTESEVPKNPNLDQFELTTSGTGLMLFSHFFGMACLTVIVQKPHSPQEGPGAIWMLVHIDASACSTNVASTTLWPSPSQR